MRRLLAFCFLSSVLCPLVVHAQQSPKENAEVLVGVRFAAKGLATSDQMLVQLWLAGEPDIINNTYAGAGTGTTTYAPGLHALMKPNRHYQARITPSGSWVRGEVKFSAPAGYSIWINDLPASTTYVDTTPFLVFKVEVRPDSGADILPAGEAAPPRVEALIWQISAGRYANGLPAGSVQWRASGLSAGLLDPTSLLYTEPSSPEISVIRHSDGALLELHTFQFLLYVRRNTTAGTGYDIEIYSPVAIRTSGSGDGPYTYDESPYLIYRVSNPTAPTWSDRIKIEKIADSNTELWDITQSGSNWTTVETSSLRTITRTSTGSAPRVETVTVKDNANVVATKLQRKYQVQNWGQEEMIEETANPDATNGPALTTTYAYWNTAGTGGYGRLKSIANPDGSWVRFDYDDSGAGFGNLTGVFRPWQDSSGVGISNAGTSNCHATILSYTGMRDVFNELSAGAETKILGTTAAKNTVAYNFTGVAGNGQPLRAETITTHTASGSTLVSSRKIYDPASAWADYNSRLYAQTAPDGTKLSTLRFKGQLLDFGDGGLWVKKSGTPSLNVMWAEYRFHGFSTQVQDSVAVTSFDSTNLDALYMVPNRSTVEILIYDDEGRVRFQVPCVFTGATSGVPAFENTDRQEFTYWNGQPYGETKLTGWQHQRMFLNNRPVWDITNDAIATWISYDALGRVTSTQKTPVTASGEYPALDDYATIHTYDAAGRVLSTRVTSDVGNGATTDSVTTARVFNLAGLLTSETAESGGGNFTTTYAYTNGGRTVTATLPGGATKIVDRWIDGSVKSVTGTGVVAEYHQTDVNTSNGTLTAATYILRASDVSAPTSAPRWSKVTTDWAGRKTKEERPAPPGASPSVFTKEYFYNSVGQLIKTTETALADTLVAYNAWQQAYRSGLDLNANGSLDPSSTDRITETDTLFEKDGSNAWWTKTTTKAWNVDNNATPVTTAVAKTRLNKYVKTGGNDVQSETVATDIFGNTTTRTIAVQRGSSWFETNLRLITETIDHPDSTTNEVAVTRNGLLQKRQTKEDLVYRTYYDGRGRPIKTTDPRTDTSTTARLAYVNNSDRIAWRDDTAANRTSYTYESATGRLATQTDPLSKVARYSYTTRGELYRTWGDTAYPVEYAFDDYGQRVTMKTYRGGTGWAGATWPGSPGTADTTTWAFDPATGTLTSKTDAASEVVAYTYTTRNQLKTRTWARGVSTTYNYSATTAEQTGIDYSDSTPDLTYTYNRLGQSATVADVTGTRTFNYSATTTQLAQEDLGSFVGTRSVNYQYDSTGTGTKGRLTYLGVGATSTPGNEYNFTYGYDTYGRINQVWTFTYTYAANSNLIASISDSASSWTQTRTYETNRDLLDVIETKWVANSKAKFDYTSDTLGRHTSVAKTGEMYSRYSTAGLDTHYGYNDRSEVTSEVSKLGGTSTVLAGRDDAYAFDHIGNRSSATHNGTSSSYTANSLNQYTQRAVAGSLDITGLAPAAATVSVNSSSAGITRHNDWYFRNFAVTNTSASVWQSLTIDSSLGGSITRKAFVPMTPEPFTYDDDGNLLSDGRWDYAYDAENRLISVQTKVGAIVPNGPIPQADARRLEFKNDYLGRRVQKTVRGGWNGTVYTTVVSDTKSLYNGWNLLREMDATSGLATIRGYVWGLDWSGTLQGAGGVGGLLHERDAATATSLRAAYDGNGNLMGLLNATDGTLAAAYEYDAFGNTLRATGSHAASNPFRFSTKYTDTETGLVYYGLRYYSPTLGRFINKDPIEERGGLNLYGFCGNNGVNRWDYLGMDYQLRDMDPLGNVTFSGDPDSSWTPYAGEYTVQWNNTTATYNGWQDANGVIYTRYVAPTYTISGGFQDSYDQELFGYGQDSGLQIFSDDQVNRALSDISASNALAQWDRAHAVASATQGADLPGYKSARGAHGGITVWEDRPGGEVIYSGVHDQIDGQWVTVTDNRSSNANNSFMGQMNMMFAQSGGAGLEMMLQSTANEFAYKPANALSATLALSSELTDMVISPRDQQMLMALQPQLAVLRLPRLLHLQPMVAPTIRAQVTATLIQVAVPSPQKQWQQMTIADKLANPISIEGITMEQAALAAQARELAAAQARAGARAAGSSPGR